MVQRSIEQNSTYKIFITSLNNQLFVSASVVKRDAEAESTAKEIYGRIAELLSVSSSQIIHERCFADIGLQKQILEARAGALRKRGLDADTPVTFVEGESCIDNKFAGIQIRALRPYPESRVWTILEQGVPRGRAWNLDGSTFYMLQSVDGGKVETQDSADRKTQSEAMFRHAEKILQTEGADYKDVVRTWIYISDILDWYGDFNIVRNHCYSDYGFLGGKASDEQAEQIYLPASTGIEGRNPGGLPATMDVFAVHRRSKSAIQIRPLYGVKQRSPFRYGSAFSRAMVIEEPGSKLILVSGTASIDEQGKSVFLNDPEAQIRQSLNVVSELVATEGAAIQDLCEATVFIKRQEDFPVYQKVVEHLGISELPSVCVLADVCREELLFELDATFILEKE
jgi:enamine deaminase RidA (YjgF/YER057c/UK114 family)